MTSTERLQQLDAQLWKQLSESNLEAEEVRLRLLPPQQYKADALRNALRCALEEMRQLPSSCEAQACLDAMELCSSELDKLRSALATIHQNVVNLQRQVASCYYDTHCDMLPYLSQEEIACINATNQLRISTGAVPSEDRQK